MLVTITFLLQHQHSSENNADTPFDFTDKNYDIVSLLSHPARQIIQSCAVLTYLI